MTAGHRSATGRVLVAVGAALALLVMAWWGTWLVDRALATTTVTHETFAAAGTVELYADDDVTVRAAAGATDVEVEAVRRGGFVDPELTAAATGGTLVVANGCRGWEAVDWSCGGELHVVVPPGTEVVVRSEYGTVEATGPAATLDLRSANGDVLAAGARGYVRASSGNGRVEARELDGDAELSSANEDVEADSVAGDLVATSGNGGIEATGVGGAVTARTDNGDVEVMGAGGDVDASAVDGDVVVVGDDDPVALTIRTADGRQVVDGATDPGAARTVEIRTANGDVAYLAR